MSLFRGPEFAKNVSQDSLILLIKETGQALLDPRLASTPQHESVNLDETTSSQLVRAINKVSICLSQEFIPLMLCSLRVKR